MKIMKSVKSISNIKHKEAWKGSPAVPDFSHGAPMESKPFPLSNVGISLQGKTALEKTRSLRRRPRKDLVFSTAVFPWRENSDSDVPKHMESIRTPWEESGRPAGPAPARIHMFPATTFAGPAGIRILTTTTFRKNPRSRQLPVSARGSGRGPYDSEHPPPLFNVLLIFHKPLFVRI